MTQVRIPPTLRNEVGGARQVDASGATVGELLDDLAERYPALGQQILADGVLATFVNVYLDGEDVRTIDGLDTPVNGDQTLILLPAMAGGEPEPVADVLLRRARAAGSQPARSLLDLVGSTPLVELPRLSPKPSVKLYAKLEGQNPTGSIKDRVAKAMIERAEAAGESQQGRHLLEPTSGNTGISLAMVARLRGYPLTCVLPENATPERKRLLRLYGAELVLSPGEEGSNGAVRLALELAERDPRFFMPFQYANPANVEAHYHGTGAEIVAALDRVDVLVAGLGTGGTLMGAGERIREAFPDVVVAAAEPLPGDPVMGLRSLADGYVPPILDVVEARPQGAGLERGVGRLAPRPAARWRASSPASPAGPPSTSRDGSPRSSTRVSWSRCSPTAAGSTSPPTSGTRTRMSGKRWSRPSGGDPGGRPPRARRACARGGPQRGVRDRRDPRRGRRAVRPRAEQRAVALPFRARGRPARLDGISRTRVTRSPSSTRTSRARHGRRAPT